MENMLRPDSIGESLHQPRLSLDPDSKGPFEQLPEVEKFALEKVESTTGVIQSQKPYYYGCLIAQIREEDIVNIRALGAGSESRRNSRILQELGRFHSDETLPYLSISPIDQDFDKILACIEGRPDSPYAGGVFWIHITYPDLYPMSPPKLRFITPIYHPNVDEVGDISLDILQKAWTPALSTLSLLLSVVSVLHDPIVADAVAPDIAEEYTDDYNCFSETAQLYTIQFAEAKRPDPSGLFDYSVQPSKEVGCNHTYMN
jgi:ubiquitin-conjugating enzyme E2 D/E